MPDVIEPFVLPKGDDGMPTPDVVRLCVLPKGDDGMPRPTSFDRVCCATTVMSYYARRCPTMRAVQGR